MTSVELHSAFHWLCDKCGRTSFIPAVVADLPDDAARRGTTGFQMPLYEAISEDPEGCQELEQIISRIAIAPNHVTCEHCGTVYATEIPHYGGTDDERMQDEV